jgi:SRSO17 transposase
MLERALAAGVPAGWVTGDEVYGGNPALRGWLERHQMPYVLAIKCTERLFPVGDDDIRLAPGPATTDGKPPGSRERHELQRMIIAAA